MNSPTYRQLCSCFFIALLLIGITFGLPRLEADCVTPPAGMVGWWPGDGNFADIAGGHNGTPVGNTTFAIGLVDQAFSLDGSQDYVEVPNSPDLQFCPTCPLTIDLWAYRTGGEGSVMHLIGKRGEFACSSSNTEGTYQMGWNASPSPGHFFFGNPGGPQVDVFQDLPLNTWTHLAGTFDGSTYRFYINGVLAGVTSGNLGPVNNSTLRIGGSGACNTFPGLLDEVEIFNRALSEEEIQAIYNAGSAGKCKPEPTPTPTPGPCVEPPPNMVGWWPGDGNADDIQGSNNGSLQNGATFVAGKVSQAFSLDGVDDFVAIPHDDSLNPTGPFSVDLWVNANPQQSESLALIIDKSHGWTDGSGWGIQSSATTTCFFYGTGANTGDFHGACTPTGIFDGQWHYLAGVWTGTEIQIYQDAVLRDTLAFSTPPVNNARDVHIGMSWGESIPNRRSHELLDEVEIFNRALTAVEIEAIYNAGSAGKCKPTPTPTPTATATATPTPIATGTATATATFTPTPTATATFTPTPTATATAMATPTATSTPTPTPTPTSTPIQVSQITPTGTTCNDFSGGTAQTLSTIQYSVKNGTINQENPGVFYYWVRVTAAAGSNTFVVNQSITTGSFSTLFGIASGSNVYSSSCSSVHAGFTQSSINSTTGTVTATFTAPAAGTYYIGIKFSLSSVTGKTAPTPTTVSYSYSTTGVPGSTNSLNLVKK